MALVGNTFRTIEALIWLGALALGIGFVSLYAEGKLPALLRTAKVPAASPGQRESIEDLLGPAPRSPKIGASKEKVDPKPARVNAAPEVKPVDRVPVVKEPMKAAPPALNPAPAEAKVATNPAKPAERIAEKQEPVKVHPLPPKAAPADAKAMVRLEKPPAEAAAPKSAAVSGKAPLSPEPKFFVPVRSGWPFELTKKERTGNGSTETSRFTESGSAIYFAFGSAALNASAESALKQVTTEAASHPGSRIVVRTFTDGVGTVCSNGALSELRAKSVSRFLTAHGVDPKRISLFALGPQNSFASNESAHGRSLNRRAEVLIER